MKIPDYVFTCLKNNEFTLKSKSKIDELEIKELDELLSYEDGESENEYDKRIDAIYKKHKIKEETDLLLFKSDDLVIRIAQKYEFESLDEYDKTRDDFTIDRGWVNENDDNLDDDDNIHWEYSVPSYEIKSQSDLNDFIHYSFTLDSEDLY